MTTPARMTGPPGSSAVAGGSPEAVAAALEVLRAGGSAIDGALAAAFAAVMSEPVLTSLGGGGFCLSAEPGAAPEVLDFFVDVPGRGGAATTPHVETVVVDFARTGSAAGSSEQVFHGGWGTVAVPGCLSGYLVAHERSGALPLAEVVAPAIALARRGVDLTEGQRTFLHLVSDLLDLTPESRALFAEAAATGRYRNQQYAHLLTELAAGRVTGLADHVVGDALLAASEQGGGVLTRADLAAYRPEFRTPLSVARGGARVWTNPPPSAGGAIVVGALARLADGGRGRSWTEVADALARSTLERRGPGQVPTGTTHISVVDGRGGLAAITTSNGSGSGTVIPGWGVALNNMLGEEDLQPSDGSRLPPGARMGSMMAPTLVDLPDGSRVVLGTGGSERIRSALLGVILRLVDEGRPLDEAVAAPRLHLNGTGPVHVEPGFDDADLAALAGLAVERGWPGVEQWPAPNLFFGGVHAVQRRGDGSVLAVGDARRTGSVGVVEPGTNVP
jgi:gamma-glutamyltranspeptidase/glutathione hydrolase